MEYRILQASPFADHRINYCPLRTALIVAAIALRKMGRVEDKRPKAGAVGKATPDVAVEDGAIAQVEKRPGIEKENDLARDRDLEEVDLEEKK